jgi:hypothetical protein
MSDQLLQLEVRILLLKYGRQKVLCTLAQLGDQSLEELEQHLLAIEQKRPIGRPKPTAVEIAAVESRGREEIAEPLRALAVAFQNKAFLPQLRDVQRFLDRIAPPGKLKSRDSAAPSLFRALAKLPEGELVRLAAPDDSGGQSEFSILARAIMGTPKSHGKTPGPEQIPTSD